MVYLNPHPCTFAFSTLKRIFISQKGMTNTLICSVFEILLISVQAHIHTSSLLLPSCTSRHLKPPMKHVTCICLSPHDVSLAVKIGHALVSTHDYLKATNYYVTALQAHADDISLRHDLATLFMKLKRSTEMPPRSSLTYCSLRAPCQRLPKMSNEVQSLLLLAEVHARAAKGVAIVCA